MTTRVTTDTDGYITRIDHDPPRGGTTTRDTETARITELRNACIAAHAIYENTDDIEVANYDDEDSFIEKVDGGYWVEARVWVEADE